MEHPNVALPAASQPSAVVTGGGRGIGCAIAVALAKAGHRVLIVGRDAPRLDATCAAANGLEPHVADLATPRGREDLVARVRTWSPALQLLVNNAGVQHTGAIGDRSATELEDEVQVNLVAPLVLATSLLPELRAGAGTVVNVTSVLAVHPKVAAPVYCATKAGLRSFTTALRDALAPDGVRVVELMPPLVETDMTAGRGRGKLAPDAVARALLVGLTNDRSRIAVGKARPFLWVDRVAPALAARIVRRA